MPVYRSNRLPEPPRSDLKLRLGWLEQRAIAGESLSADEQTLLDDRRRAHPFAVAVAAQAYHDWFGERFATHVERRRFDDRKGRWTVDVRRVRRPAHATPTATTRPARPRERRPTARTARSSSRSGDSPDDDPAPHLRRHPEAALVSPALADLLDRLGAA